ncbi:MAG: glycosyltransferase [Alphaproteobacteria bacterium]|nr:MAG: glycosyltransferase [Alphaproteobacteria bacterium]
MNLSRLPTSPLDAVSDDAVAHRGICAVVVTHNRGQDVLHVLDSIVNQVEHIVIIDNASSDATCTYLWQFAHAHPQRCHIIEHAHNNLAKAQNLGIHYACMHGYEWVMLMDHDSIAKEGMVAQMLLRHHYHASYQPIGMIVPNLIEQQSTRVARYVRMRSRWRYVRTPFEDRAIFDDVMLAIASGSLIPTAVCAEIGAMDESLCIDNVDFDFSLRVLRSGRKILAVRDAHLLHRLGACYDHHILGSTITTTNHQPMRRYYIYRNRVRLWLKHGGAFPCYVLFDLCAIAYDLFKISCFEANRFAKIKAIWHGIGDALRGRMGSAGASRY